MTYVGRAYGVRFAESPITQGTTPHREKGQNMAERRETRQEQEVRWNAQRTTRDQEFQAGQHARRKKNRRIWLTVAAIVLIIAVMAAVVLL